jgi:hypothetical protein
MITVYQSEFEKPYKVFFKGDTESILKNCTSVMNDKGEKINLSGKTSEKIK